MTEIDPFPPGLLSRRMFPIDQGRIVVEEKWNIDVPGCPLVRIPWINSNFDTGPIRIRQVVMTYREYAEAKVPLRLEPSHQADGAENV